jgi:hypothetical protein
MLNYDTELLGPMLHHGGDTIHYHGAFILLPESRVSVAVLSNSIQSRSVLYQIALDALQGQMEIKMKTRAKQMIPANPSAEPSVNDETLKSLEGDYLYTGGPALRLKVKDSHLKASMGPIHIDLTAVSQTDFMPSLTIFGLIPIFKNQTRGRLLQFRKIQDEIHLYMRGLSGSYYRLLSRIPSVPIPDSWLNREGSYHVENQDDPVSFDHVKIIQKDRRLYLSGRIFQMSPALFALKFIRNDLAVVDGVGRYAGMTLQVRQDTQGEYILFSGYRLRRSE